MVGTEATEDDKAATIVETTEEKKEQEVSTKNKKEDESAAESPDTKKRKIMTDSGNASNKDGGFPMAPDEEWPDAWMLAEDDPTVETEQCKEHRQEPNVKVTAADMKKLGIFYWKMDAKSYEYPEMAVPWDPQDATDPKLKALRDDRGYSYADVITIHPDKLPDFDKKIKSFFEEHIHDAEEIRYILGGSGFFDVRDFNDKWVRVHVKAGDLMTLPEGTYVLFGRWWWWW
jgi:1,2-dihydroxy-3-keto-5-methylthiopentene dioxygenase